MRNKLCLCHRCYLQNICTSLWYILVQELVHKWRNYKVFLCKVIISENSCVQTRLKNIFFHPRQAFTSKTWLSKIRTCFCVCINNLNWLCEIVITFRWETTISIVVGSIIITRTTNIFFYLQNIFFLSLLVTVHINFLFFTFLTVFFISSHVTCILFQILTRKEKMSSHLYWK